MDTLTFGQIIVAALPYLEGIIGLVLAGGWAKTWVTLRQTKKAAELENEASAVSLLEKDIERKIAEISTKDERIAALEEKLASKATIIEDLNQKINKSVRKASRISTCMCIHFGCRYRDPQLGSGMRWFEENESDFHLGCDYLTIEEIMAQKAKPVIDEE